MHKFLVWLLLPSIVGAKTSKFELDANLNRTLTEILVDPNCNEIAGQKRDLSAQDREVISRLLDTHQRKLALHLSEVGPERGAPVREMLSLNAKVNTCGASSLKPLGVIGVYSAFLMCPEMKKYDNSELEMHLSRSITNSDSRSTKFVFSLLDKIEKEFVQISEGPDKKRKAACQLPAAPKQIDSRGFHNIVAEQLGLFSAAHGGSSACSTIYTNCHGYGVNYFTAIDDDNVTRGHVGSQFVTMDSQAALFHAIANEQVFKKWGKESDRRHYSERLIKIMSVPLNNDDFNDWAERAKATTPSIPRYGSVCALIEKRPIETGKKTFDFPKSCFSFNSQKALNSHLDRLLRKTGSLTSLSKSCANDFSYIELADGSKYMMGAFLTLKGDPSNRKGYAYELNSKLFGDLTLILNALRANPSQICNRKLKPIKSPEKSTFENIAE